MDLFNADSAITFTSTPIGSGYVVRFVAVTGFTSHTALEPLTVENPKDLTYLERYAMEPRHRRSWSCPSTLHGRLAALKPRCARFDWRRHCRRVM